MLVLDSASRHATPDLANVLSVVLLLGAPPVCLARACAPFTPAAWVRARGRARRRDGLGGLGVRRDFVFVDAIGYIGDTQRFSHASLAGEDERSSPQVDARSKWECLPCVVG